MVGMEAEAIQEVYVLLTRLPKAFDQISNEAEKDGASYGKHEYLVEQWLSAHPI